VLGYPDQIPAAAAALTADHLNFGSVETYDPKQEQLGNADLARRLPERLVRVQAIAKPEATNSPRRSDRAGTCSA